MNFRENKPIFIGGLLFLILTNLVLSFKELNSIDLFKIVVASNGGIVQCSSFICSWNDFVVTVSNLLKEIVTLSFWVAVLLSVVGSFVMMFGGVKEENYQKGKSMIMVAIVGYSLILLSGIIFDVILDFFQPQFNIFMIKFALAAPGSSGSTPLTPITYFDPLKKTLTGSLQCGGTATSSIEKIINCAFEAIGALSSLAVILLGIAIFASAAYLISTPLFGLKNIPKAWQILVWSIIGLIIVLLANLIKDQIIRLTTFNNNFVFAQVEPGKVEFEWTTKTVRVCPPSILGSNKCEYPSIQAIASSVVMFIIDRLAPPLLVLLIIIGGFFYLLSPFDIKNIQTGHNYIKWAVYGYFILLIITAILSVISAFLGGPASP